MFCGWDLPPALTESESWLRESAVERALRLEVCRRRLRSGVEKFLDDVNLAHHRRSAQSRREVARPRMPEQYFETFLARRKHSSAERHGGAAPRSNSSRSTAAPAKRLIATKHPYHWEARVWHRRLRPTVA